MLLHDLEAEVEWSGLRPQGRRKVPRSGAAGQKVENGPRPGDVQLSNQPRKVLKNGNQAWAQSCI